MEWIKIVIQRKKIVAMHKKISKESIKENTPNVASETTITSNMDDLKCKVHICKYFNLILLNGNIYRCFIKTNEKDCNEMYSLFTGVHQWIWLGNRQCAVMFNNAC